MKIRRHVQICPILTFPHLSCKGGLHHNPERRNGIDAFVILYREIQFHLKLIYFTTLKQGREEKGIT